MNHKFLYISLLIPFFDMVQMKSLHIYCKKPFIERVKVYAHSKGLTVSSLMRLSVIERMESKDDQRGLGE